MLNWIPVGERLPKSSELVAFVTLKYEDVDNHKTYYIVRTGNEVYHINGRWIDGRWMRTNPTGEFRYGEEDVTDKVVAWMPWPNPYYGG